MSLRVANYWIFNTTSGDRIRIAAVDEAVWANSTEERASRINSTKFAEHFVPLRGGAKQLFALLKLGRSSSQKRELCNKLN